MLMVSNPAVSVFTAVSALFFPPPLTGHPGRHAPPASTVRAPGEKRRAQLKAPNRGMVHSSFRLKNRGRVLLTVLTCVLKEACSLGDVNLP